MTKKYYLKMMASTFNWSMIICSFNKEILITIKKLFKHMKCILIENEEHFANININLLENEYIININKEIYKTKSLNSIVELINSNWFQRLSLVCNDYIFLHGCLFTYKNKCCLLLGPSHCGKSTLMFQLSSCELVVYGGDDIIPISISNKNIIPFPNPIHLRNDRYIEAYSNDKHNILKSENNTFSVFPRLILNKPLKSIDFVFYLDRKKDENKISLHEVPKNRNLELLLQNCWPNIDVKNRITILIEVFNNCKGYILRFNDQNSAEYIMKFIDRSV